jgi:multidrug efflux pump subunit AcrB
MGIVRFALKFPYTFYVLAALILFLGGAAIVTMPTDIFPQINIPVVTVIWQYTGLSTPEMEQRVTTYSQYAMSSNVSGIKDMEAQTLNGICSESLLPAGRQSRLAISQIVAATNAIRSHASRRPASNRRAVQCLSVPVLQLTLTSNNLNEQQLYDYGIIACASSSPPFPGSRFRPPMAVNTGRSWSTSTR